MDAAKREKILVVVALIALYIIWGSTYLTILWAIEDIPPLLMAGVRFLIAGLLLFTVLVLRGNPLPTRREWVGAGIVGVLLLVGRNGGVTLAEQWIPSGLAAVVVASMPLWAALISTLMGRTPTKLEWLGLAIGFSGVVLLMAEGDMRANPVGILFLIGATILWALGSMWSRRLVMPQGLMASAAQMLVGSAVFLLLSYFAGERLTTMPGPRAIGSLVYLIVFGSLVGYTSYLFLLKTVKPTLATSYAYVNPVVAVLLGVALAGERITAIGITAMAIILASVLLITVSRDRKPTLLPDPKPSTSPAAGD